MSKRILINQNDELLKAICKDLNKYQANFKQVLIAYKALDLGEFTQADFKEILSGDADQIIARYKKGLNDELDTTGVKNTILRNVVLQGTDEPIADFLQAVKTFLSTDLAPSRYGLDNDRTAFLSLSKLSFNNGELFISEDSKEHILEAHCRLYVESENEYLVYDAALKMQAALQDFRDALFELGFPMNLYDLIGGKGYIVDHHITEFFSCGEDKKVVIKPSAIKWAATYKTEQERMRKMSQNR